MRAVHKKCRDYACAAPVHARKRVLYVLDEPSIGLHQRDNDRLLQTLKNLRDQGNTVIVVEHDEEAIRERNLSAGAAVTDLMAQARDILQQRGESLTDDAPTSDATCAITPCMSSTSPW